MTFRLHLEVIRVRGKVLMAAGGAVLLAGLIAPHVRLFPVGLGGMPVSVTGLHALCGSALGQIATSASRTLRGRCAAAVAGVAAGWLMVAAGIVGVAVGATGLQKR